MALLHGGCRCAALYIALNCLCMLRCSSALKAAATESSELSPDVVAEAMGVLQEDMQEVSALLAHGASLPSVDRETRQTAFMGATTGGEYAEQRPDEAMTGAMALTEDSAENTTTTAADEEEVSQFKNIVTFGGSLDMVASIIIWAATAIVIIGLCLCCFLRPRDSGAQGPLETSDEMHEVWVRSRGPAPVRGRT
mmetsp:Transcript_36567/g.67012  ORF Transcript_36567/g.67012 Transcript_36567/m.67012 type:complete len:195 (-) Transcript_36567:66-650(-)